MGGVSRGARHQAGLNCRRRIRSRLAIARLTAQEEQRGLLRDPATIGTRAGWERRLHEAGFVLRGHRLVRC